MRLLDFVSVLSIRNYTVLSSQLCISHQCFILFRFSVCTPNDRQFDVGVQGQIQTFKKGGYTLELQLQPSCKLKTKNKKNKKGHHLLTIAAPQ